MAKQGDQLERLSQHVMQLVAAARRLYNRSIQLKYTVGPKWKTWTKIQANADIFGDKIFLQNSKPLYKNPNKFCFDTEYKANKAS